MATLTPAKWQEQILFELGTALSGGPVPEADQAALLAGLKAQLPTLWAMNADRGATARLLYLHTKRQAALTLQGQVRSKIDFTLGPLSPRQSQFFGNLKALYDQATAEIALEEKRLRAGRGPAIGQIYRTAPRQPVVAPPPEVRSPDPNDPRYNPGPLESCDGFTPR